MKTKIASLTLLGLLLVSCKSGIQYATPQAAQATAKSHEYALKVQVQPQDTPETLAQQYLGEVLVFAPERQEAILGLSAEQAKRLSLNVAATSQGPVLSAQGNKSVVLEKNAKTFSSAAQSQSNVQGAGRVSIWNSGRVSIWLSGRVSIWLSGGYAPVPENTQTWQQVRLEAAQKLAPKLGSGVKVAVLDTGIDLNHIAFQGSIDTAGMWDFVGGDAQPQEEGTWGAGAYGHGTNVAGIVLQVAPSATILPLRVLDQDGQGDAVSVAQAIDHAANKGAKVIHMSLGSTTFSQIVHDALLRATNRGILVVASTGNTGDEQVTSPAREMSGSTFYGRMATSVGSVNGLGHKSSFSTYGSLSAPIDMMAPGESVYAPAPKDQLAAWSGTSMAAPIVSGAYALALGQKSFVPLPFYSSVMAQRGLKIDHLAPNQPFAGKIGQQVNIAGFIEGLGVTP